MHTPGPLDDVFRFPLMEALFGRRARRFGLGMTLPSGPLAYTSPSEPFPLTELEQAILVASATGVSGWSYGVPFGPMTPESHAEFTVRFTGRTAPTAAGIGTPALLYTDDHGCYATRTRDVTPERIRELGRIEDDAERILATVRDATRKIRDTRLDLPASPPHMLPPNLWMANAPGSTLFMPVGDASEQFLGLLALAVRHGVVIVDQDTGGTAGDLAPFIRSGLLDDAKRMPLSELQQDAYEMNCLEVAFMGHNIVLAMQAMGLGGLYLSGLDRWSVLGGRAGDGIEGLGFRFVEDERWPPNPVGLDGVYEALCPPYHADMHEAVAVFVDRKFGPGGAYDPATGGPWKSPAVVKGSVEPYSDEFIDCLGTVSQYVFEKHGRFPGTRTTIVLPGYVQAVHLDTGFYDAHYGEGAYFATHAEHMDRWHGRDDGEAHVDVHRARP
jgi:hypothetical protein